MGTRNNKASQPSFAKLMGWAPSEMDTTPDGPFDQVVDTRNEISLQCLPCPEGETIS